MKLVPQQGSTSSPSNDRNVDPRKVPTQPEMVPVGAAWASALPSDTTPTPLIPPPGPKPPRISIPIDAIDALAGGGLMHTVPCVVWTNAELEQAPLDHREWFVLALIDGKTSVEGLLDVADMPGGEVIASLERLRRLGIVVLR